MKKRLVLGLVTAVMLSNLTGCGSQIKIVREDTGNEVTVGDVVDSMEWTGDSLLTRIENWILKYTTGEEVERKDPDIIDKVEENWNEVKEKTGSDILNSILDFGSGVYNEVKDEIYEDVNTEDQPKEDPEENDISDLEVQFLDVGQGDCIYITCGDDVMLIDTGGYERKNETMQYLQKQDIDKIDYLILTHPDSDHIGCAGEIVRDFQIDNIFAPVYERDTAAYNAWTSAMLDKGYTYTQPSVGSEYVLGSAEFEIIAPSKTHEDVNDNSIVIRMSHGDNTYLFMGDAEEEEEREILLSEENIEADVIKIGHHGSKSSSSEEFMSKVDPKYAVVSCGENNDYGHPHAATLNTLMNMGVKMFRTDDQGIIISYSDGKEINWNIPESENWTSGEGKSYAGE